MAINYNLFDLKQSFRINDAARLWCEFEQINERNKRDYNIVRNTMVEAIFMGDLGCELTQREYDEHGENYIPAHIDPYGRFVSREHLVEWANSLGQKPKFLFPEERNAPKRKKPTSKALAEAPQEVVVRKEIAPRPNQIIKARCQVVALMLWEQDITLSQKEIVAHPLMKKHGYQNGSFDERTLLLWVSDVDPRPAEVKKTPFKKKEMAFDDAL
jgi:hypothetical protein